MRDLGEIFRTTADSTTLQQLNNIVSHNSLNASIKEFEKKYPRINLSFSASEIRELFEYFINKETYAINPNPERPFSAFEKLLLAVLWKNGHIDRVKPIMHGITGVDKSNSDFGVIFTQFGRSLINPEEPIVDQHTIRAFCTYGDTPDIKGHKSAHKKSAFRKDDQELIDLYRKWFKSILDKVRPEEKTEFKYIFDKILFVIGKELTKESGG